VRLWASTEWGASLGAMAEGERRRRMERSPRYHKGRFRNVEPAAKAHIVRVIRTFLTAHGKGTIKRPPAPLPLSTPSLETAPSSGLRVTWFGHSTLLFEVDGARLLTDPIWSDRASPSTLIGPLRFHPPAMRLEELGKLDAVLISHDHYDHLDMETVRRLGALGLPFVVPLGVGAHLERWGIAKDKITELDWWEEVTFPSGVRVVATPSRHFSGRRLKDRDATLWTSWSVIGPSHRLFFSGDTGLTRELEEIGERLGPFDLAMFEIGAFNEAWADIHLGPEGAVRAFQLLGAKALLPIHWATFDLGLHAWNEPVEVIHDLAEQAKIPLYTPPIGYSFEPDLEAPHDAWWRELGREPRPALEAPRVARRPRAISSWGARLRLRRPAPARGA